MSDFDVSESGDGGELILGGALTIENASAIRKQLIKTLIRTDEMVVSVDADALVDISFLQLLCSAHRTASNLGKALTLRPLPSDNFLVAVENAGFTRKRGCSCSRESDCLWVAAHE